MTSTEAVHKLRGVVLDLEEHNHILEHSRDPALAHGLVSGMRKWAPVLAWGRERVRWRKRVEGAMTLSQVGLLAHVLHRYLKTKAEKQDKMINTGRLRGNRG